MSKDVTGKTFLVVSHIFFSWFVIIKPEENYAFFIKKTLV